MHPLRISVTTGVQATTFRGWPSGSRATKSLMISVASLDTLARILVAFLLAQFEVNPPKKQRASTHGTSLSKTPFLVARWASRGSRYIRNKTLINVAAALDSCFNKFGNWFMNPIPAQLVPRHWVHGRKGRNKLTYRLSTEPSLIPYPH